jgi:hypothetical protein
LPILGYCTAVATRRGLRHRDCMQASHPTLPLVAQLEAELRVCRRERGLRVHAAACTDAAWLRATVRVCHGTRATTNAYVCLLRRCHSARVSATLPLVEEGK